MLSVVNKPFMLKAVMLNVIMLSVIMLNVIMLNVTVPSTINLKCLIFILECHQTFN